MKSTKLLLILFSVNLAACRIEVDVPENGFVETETGLFRCASGSRCEIDVAGVDFDEVFIALPNEGFRFAGWQDSIKNLCGDAGARCRLDASGLSASASLLSILESDQVYYLEPIFEPLPEAVDSDSDGIADVDEDRLGTRSDRVDSDCDAIPDGEEVVVVGNPADADGDGIIDARESAFVDSDEDGINDQDDAQTDLVVGCVDATPFVIAEGEFNRTTLELTLIGEFIDAVYVDSWTVGGLHIDGVPIESVENGDNRLVDRYELFDDGTHGDRKAGDGIYTRDAISRNYEAFVPRPPNVTDAIYFGSELFIERAGVTETVRLPEAIRRNSILGDFVIAHLSPDSTLEDVVRKAPGVWQKGNVVNLVSPVLSQSLRHGMAGEDLGTAMRDVVKRFYDFYPDDYDFILLLPERYVAGYAPIAQYFTARREAEGTGRNPFDSGSSWGSEQRLKGVVLSSGFWSGQPTLHEIGHQWMTYLDQELGFGQMGNGILDGTHNGIVGVGRGQMGGFDPDTLEDLGDGRYRVGGFGAFANGGDTVPYVPLERYLMGLADPSEVPEILVPENPRDLEFVLIDGQTMVEFTADGFSALELADIVNIEGAREPTFGAAQSDFTIAYIVVSSQPLKSVELERVNKMAKILAADENKNPYDVENPVFSRYPLSFHQATGGRGSMSSSLPVAD